MLATSYRLDQPDEFSMDTHEGDDLVAAERVSDGDAQERNYGKR
jgi:hypothetical protein